MIAMDLHPLNDSQAHISPNYEINDRRKSIGSFNDEQLQLEILIEVTPLLYPSDYVRNCSQAMMYPIWKI
jgi:hypothetical protein